MRRLCWPVPLLLLLFRCWGSDCQDRELAEMTSLNTGEYVAVCWEGRTYIPWGPVDNWDRGCQIGTVDGDRKNKIYAFRDWPVEEWLISYYDSGLMDGSMLLREEHTPIPEGLSSEYPWNNDE